jgi:hypothetical protein
MTAKAQQLFLELCLLRLRYSEAEAQEVSRLSEAEDDPFLRSVTNALRKMRPEVLAKTPRRQPPASPSRGVGSARIERSDVEVAIGIFANRIARKRILQTDDEVSNFAKSIGVERADGTRKGYAAAIQKALEGLPKGEAIERMQGADRHFMSDSRPFVELAKTIMKGKS